MMCSGQNAGRRKNFHCNLPSLFDYPPTLTTTYDLIFVMFLCTHLTSGTETRERERENKNKDIVSWVLKVTLHPQDWEDTVSQRESSTCVVFVWWLFILNRKNCQKMRHLPDTWIAIDGSKYLLFSLNFLIWVSQLPFILHFKCTFSLLGCGHDIHTNTKCYWLM